MVISSRRSITSHSKPVDIRIAMAPILRREKLHTQFHNLIYFTWRPSSNIYLSIRPPPQSSISFPIPIQNRIMSE